MGDMLKITLPGVLDAGVDFPKLNELRISVITLIPNELTRINIEMTSASVMRVSGATKFYDSTGVTDLGQSVNLVAGSNSLYIKPVGNFYVGIDNKFAILRFGNNYFFSLPTNTGTSSAAVLGAVKLQEVKFISGLLKLHGNNLFTGNIANTPKTITQYLTPCGSTGTINSLTGELNSSTFNYSILTDLDLNNQKSITSNFSGVTFGGIRSLNLSNTNLNGEITALNNNINTINCENNDVAINLSVLANKSAIISLNLSGSLATGDIANISNVAISSLNSFAGLNLSGDISRLNNACIYFNNANTPSTLKNKRANLSTTLWTNKRADRTYILAVAGVRMTSGVDQFFIDMATLELSPTAVSGGVWLRTISIIGTRTSVSDSAVATLTSKGVTITLTNPS